MKTRYSRNIGAITEEEQQTLFGKCAVVVGLGGLGGYIVEYLARLGIGEIRICDFDVYDESNLNRQLCSSESNLGKSKAETTAGRIKDINSDIKVVVFDEKFTAHSGAKILDGADIVLDALDNISSRLVLENEACRHKIPLVFAALSGYEGQISTVMPDAPVLAKLYKGMTHNLKPSVMPFTPSVISAYQVSEAVKVLLGRGELAHKLLIVDIYNNETQLINI